MGVALLVFLLLALFAFLGPLVRHVNPDLLDLANQSARVSWAHPLGTDETGRDVLARLMYGGRVSLTVGAAAMLCALAIGSIVGAASGYYVGWVDMVLMRVTDGAMAVPPIFIALTALTLLGATTAKLVLVIGLTSWMSLARLIRGEVLTLRQELYVDASRALGAPDARILLRHILPHLLPTISVTATLGVANAILMESALSFLGLGVQPPTASWGNMLSGAQDYVYSAPRLAVYPGMLILLTVLTFNGLGAVVRDLTDPRIGGALPPDTRSSPASAGGGQGVGAAPVLTG